MTRTKKKKIRYFAHRTDYSLDNLQSILTCRYELLLKICSEEIQPRKAACARARTQVLQIIGPRPGNSIYTSIFLTYLPKYFRLDLPDA